MTANDDFDRISRAWLDLMPDEAPDRAVDAVLRAVATTPQVRRWRPASWRPLPMNRLPFAFAAVAIAVAIGGAVLLVRPGTDRNPGACQRRLSRRRLQHRRRLLRPAGRSRPSCRRRFMGGPNDFVAPRCRVVDPLRREFFELAQSNENDDPKLTAQASLSDAGIVPPHCHRLDCHASRMQAATHDWSLSPSGRVLTLSVIADACTQREYGAARATWSKMGCTIADDTCLGLLDAGTYTSQFISPRLDPGAAWSPVVGGLTYTVPDGWANASTGPSHSSSCRQPSCRRSTTPTGDWNHRRLHAADGHDPGSGRAPTRSSRRRPDGRRPCQLARNRARTRHDRANADHDRRSSRADAGHPLDPRGPARARATRTRDSDRHLPEPGTRPSAVTSARG